VDTVVDHDVVADLDVVAVGDGDALEKPAVVAALGEQVVAEHLSESEREIDVVGHRRGVELPPEPLEVFGTLELLLVLLGVVLRLQRGVARVVPLQADAFGSRHRLAVLPRLPALAVAVEVDQCVSDHLAGVLPPRRGARPPRR